MFRITYITLLVALTMFTTGYNYGVVSYAFIQVSLFGIMLILEMIRMKVLERELEGK